MAEDSRRGTKKAVPVTQCETEECTIMHSRTRPALLPPKQPHIRNNPNFSIFIEHLPTKHKTSFDGWVTGFSDRFNSSWSGTPVYGRMDDLYTFQRTGRIISIAFDVIAASPNEAQANQLKLNRLTQFLYPVYTDQESGASARGKNQRVLVAPPLLRMGWANMVEGIDGNGLVGFVNGFSYTPEITSGQFFDASWSFRGGTSSIPGGAKILNYQHFKVQLEFTVLHTHLLGWSRTTAPTGPNENSYFFGDGETSWDDMGTFPHRAGHPAADLATIPITSDPYSLFAEQTRTALPAAAEEKTDPPTDNQQAAMDEVLH